MIGIQRSRAMTAGTVEDVKKVSCEESRNLMYSVRGSGLCASMATLTSSGSGNVRRFRSRQSTRSGQMKTMCVPLSIKAVVSTERPAVCP